MHTKKKSTPHATFVACAALTLAIAVTFSASAASLKNVFLVPGEMSDKMPLGVDRGGASANRLGGFGSDIYYDRFANVFYALTDRGPGGGTMAYATRVHKFRLDIDPVTGVAGNFNLLASIPFTIPSGRKLNGIAGPANFNGIDPQLNPSRTSARNPGLSHDPEGFVVAPNGHFYVSDEYGPSIYEFSPDGAFVRALRPPANVVPHDEAGVNFSSLNSVTPIKGRQRNRGFEGLAISPDGRRLFALLQDPLADEGTVDPDCGSGCTPAGRFSRNVRLIAYSAVTGESIAQYIYQLEDLASVNIRVPQNPFSPNAQGANIGVSALVAINDHEFLALERDNRGLGIDDPTGSIPVSTKRIYRLDITDATNVNHIRLAGTNTLPPGIVPVSKKLFIDLLSELRAAGSSVPEKIEGLTIGPRLADGSYELLVISDNDFSVTQNNSETQFDVCTNGTTSQQVPIDAGCSAGMSLLPTFLMSFKTDANELELPSPIRQLLTLLANPDSHVWASRTLTLKLRTVEKLMSTGQSTQACQALENFSRQVRQKSAKSISPSQIARLVTGTAAVQQALGCK